MTARQRRFLEEQGIRVEDSPLELGEKDRNRRFIIYMVDQPVASFLKFRLTASVYMARTGSKRARRWARCRARSSSIRRLRRRRATRWSRWKRRGLRCAAPWRSLLGGVRRVVGASKRDGKNGEPQACESGDAF